MMAWNRIYQCAGCTHTFYEKLPDVFIYSCPKCFTENRCTNGIAVKRDSALKIPEDLSPLEIGLICRWNECQFEIIGRMRFIYVEGYYRNQWLLANDKGQYKWLLEAYALYAIVDFEGKKVDAKLLKNKEPGNLIDLFEDISYSLDSIAEIKSFMIEGYTPVVLNNLKGTISIELSTSKGDWAVVDLDFKQNALAYYGKIVELEELNFDRFRQLNG